MDAKKFAELMDAEAKKLAEGYEAALAQTQKAAALATEPGQVMQSVTRLDGQAREQFDQQASEARERLRGYLAQLVDTDAEKLAEAPSPEAVAALQVLALRNNVSQDELDAYRKQYGENYNVLKALDTIAKKNDLATSYETWEGIDTERIERDIDGLSLFAAETYGRQAATSFRVCASDAKDALGIETSGFFF